MSVCRTEALKRLLESERWSLSYGRALARVSTDGGIHAVCMDWRHFAELLWASVVVHSEQLKLCVCLAYVLSVPSIEARSPRLVLSL